MYGINFSLVSFIFGDIYLNFEKVDVLFLHYYACLHIMGSGPVHLFHSIYFYCYQVAQPSNIIFRIQL